MHTQPTPTQTPTPNRYSALLPAAAVFAGLLTVSHLSDSYAVSPATATAAPQPETPFNAAQQRKEQLEQLKQINERMARIETKLDKGINVKVTEMPAAAPTKP